MTFLAPRRAVRDAGGAHAAVRGHRQRGDARFAFFVPDYETLRRCAPRRRCELPTLTSKSVLLAIPFFVISGAIMTAGGIASGWWRWPRCWSVTARRAGDRVRAGEHDLRGHQRAAARSPSSPSAASCSRPCSRPATARTSRWACSPPRARWAACSAVDPDAGLRHQRHRGARSTWATCSSPGIGPARAHRRHARRVRVFRGQGGGGAHGPARPSREVRTAMREGVWALLLPVIVLGGICGGVFKNVTEASAVSIVYAAVVSCSSTGSSRGATCRRRC